MLTKIELDAGADAEPFFMPDPDRLVLHARRFQIFKSHKELRRLHGVVTVVKGNNSSDILEMQGTEARAQPDVKAIISWVKARQREGSFVVRGAERIESMPALSKHR